MKRIAIDPHSDADTIAIHIPEGDEHVCIMQIDAEHYPEGKAESNARFMVLAWNAFVAAAEKIGCDPVELAEALGDGRLAALVVRNDIELLGIREVLAVTGTALAKAESPAGEPR